MSKFLQQLLGNTEPLFSSSLHALEKSIGYDSIDVRLIADITHKAHAVMRVLGLWSRFKYISTPYSTL